MIFWLMGCPKNKIFVRFSQERINAIFFTTVKKDDGTTQRLEINVPAEDIDDRLSTLYAETGIVEQVGSAIDYIKVGDTAILDYNLFNDERKIISEDENGRVYIVDQTTTYHKERNVAFATRNIPKNQLVWEKGEIENLSQLLAIVRDGELIANHPFVFLNHLPEETQRQVGKLKYLENPEVIERQILAVSDLSAKKYDVKNGDIISVRTLDTFTVMLNNQPITCCNDEDLLTVNQEA